MYSFFYYIFNVCVSLTRYPDNYPRGKFFECLSVFDHFVGLALKGLTLSLLFLKETAKIVLITRQFQNL